MAQDVTYRLATSADVPVIHALLAENADNDGGSLGATVDDLLRYGFGAEPRFRVVLAMRGGAAVGLALIIPEYSSWRGKVGVFVQDLYVRPVARGLGVGRELLARSVHLSADWEPAFLTLMVQHKNQPAQGFYAALGFVLRGAANSMVLEGPGLGALLA